MILFIDNYDSFVYNIVQYVGKLNPNLKVIRNDRISIGEIEKLNPQQIIISAGPGYPQQAGISCQVIKRFFKDLPILGICLGHQAIATAFGGKVGRAKTLLHGKTSQVFHQETGILAGLPNPFIAGRYHSLAVHEESIPEMLKITAFTSNGEIMGIKHNEYPVYGLQFHPESALTPDGGKILENFLNGEN